MKPPIKSDFAFGLHDRVMEDIDGNHEPQAGIIVACKIHQEPNEPPYIEYLVHWGEDATVGFGREWRGEYKLIPIKGN